MKHMMILATLASLLAADQAPAVDATKPAAVRQMLSRTPLAEIPGKAAELVKSAAPADRPAAVRNALRAALELNPTLVPMLVAAIARAVPDLTEMAAESAAVLQPKMATTVAKAAASAAPLAAGRIAGAICRAVPKDYRNVSIAVAQAVPGSDREILAALAAAFPALKPAIEDALLRSPGGALSVSVVLDSSRAVDLRVIAGSASAAAAREQLTPSQPSIGPAFVPAGPPGSNAGRRDSGPVQRGGRNYASP